RYAWVREVLEKVQYSAPPFYSWRSRITAFLNRPIPGTIGLFIGMAIVFQAVFAWATPLMDLIDSAASILGASVIQTFGEGAFSSLIADGIIAGVGSVVIFLPQILILFLFIILLEDSGYLARAAYLMDRVMRSVGLSGQSIIPMISSFACAVPGIMATRVIPNRRDRIATILAAPFMTCSARLPVYALLIAAFVPAQQVGFMNLQGLVLFGLYLFGIVAGILTALLIRQTALRGPKPPFALMLPEFRRPNLQTVLIQLLGRAKVFLYRAGTVIFVVAVMVWALAYYPRSEILAPEVERQRDVAAYTLSGEALAAEYKRIDNVAAAAQMEQSWLGRAGHFVEPVFAPLGWDWRVSSAVIAGFPAREVVIAVLGTVYAVGDDADEGTLSGRLKASTWPNGMRVFTLPMVIGLLIFYACCLQCAATLAVIRRETNSWRWPIFAWVYMTSIGYCGALLAFQLGSA
ncbi:MAG: ferrous iron transporter B, partial [Woeseiaceae bacterium]